jgi:glycosyltransferase involved in cell wall biosynthesis
LRPATARIRVLVVVTTYQSVVTILDGKLQLLSRCNDLECHVVSSAEPDERRAAAVPHFSVEIPRSIRPLRDLAAVLKLYRIIRKNNYDIVHTHTAKAGMVGAIAGWLTGTPTVHTYHGLPFYEGQAAATYQIYRAIEIAASRLRKAVFSQTRRDGEVLKRLRLSCPVYYEGNGVDAETVAQNAERDGASVKGLFSETGAKILCVARLEPVKNLSMVLDVAVTLKEQKTRFSLIIAGKGILAKALDAEIERKNLRDVVSIRYTPHIHALVKEADVVVLASIKEGIPRSIMEAMALGKPVVASDVGGTNELVIDGVTGFLTPLKDPGIFSERLVRLINDTELRNKMGHEGLARVEKEFNESTIVDTWCDCYRRVLS